MDKENKSFNKRVILINYITFYLFNGIIHVKIVT